MFVYGNISRYTTKMNGCFLSIRVWGIGAMLICSCRGNQQETLDIPRPIRVAEVGQSGKMYRFYTGGVEAEEYANLAFRLSGPLIEMNVEAGQQVAKGMVIAAIDPLDDQLKYDANRAAYLTAKSRLERNVRLLEMQAVSRQEYELSEAEYVRARSAYQTSADRLSDTRLIAPFNGFVTQKYVENYQRVQAGEPVVRLMNPERLEVVFILPETSVELIRDSLKVALEFDTYPGQWFSATVKEVVDASLDGSGIPVRLAITDTAFRREAYAVLPGFSCRVRLEVTNGMKEGVGVPLSAVFKDLQTGDLSVWVYDRHSSRVSRRPIIVNGLSGSDEVEVVSGLESGDHIVIAGGNYMTDGETVKVVTD